MSGNMTTAIGVADPWTVYAHHNQPTDPAIVEERRRKRDEALARGEDPYADFKKMIAEKRVVPKSEKLWNKLTGKDKKKRAEAEAQKAKELEEEDSS